MTTIAIRRCFLAIVVAAVGAGCTGAGSTSSSADATKTSYVPTVPQDVVPNDAGLASCADATAPASADAGADTGAGVTDVPKLTTSIGSTGFVQIYNDAVFADFYEDDLIIRTAETTACVEYVRSGTKPPSPAGDLVFSGDSFGKDGGPPATVTLSPGTDGHYATFPAQPFFDRQQSMTVQMEKTGTISFPALDALTLHSPLPGTIAITTPVMPADGEAVIVKSTAPFEVRWPAPAAAAVETLRMLVSIYFVTGPTHVGDVHCAFPLADGVGAVPASLLSDLKSRVGATGALGGRLRVLAGDQRIITIGEASYVVELSASDTTNIIETSSELQ